MLLEVEEYWTCPMAAVALNEQATRAVWAAVLVKLTKDTAAVALLVHLIIWLKQARFHRSSDPTATLQVAATARLKRSLPVKVKLKTSLKNLQVQGPP